MLREDVAHLLKTKEGIANLVGENEEAIVDGLKESADAVSKIVEVVGLNDETPSRQMNVLRHSLLMSGPDNFIELLVFKAETFLGSFFPLFEVRRWSKEDVEQAYSEAVFLHRVFVVLHEALMSNDVWTLRFSTGQIAARLRTCDYEAESQNAQLKMAEMQLELARNQDDIAKRSEKMNLCMIIMTVVVIELQCVA